MNSDADLVHVPDRQGQLLERLDQQPPEVLADALDAIHARQANLKAAAGALEAELRRRLKLRQAKLAVFGEWEVAASSGRSSVWDADELEPTLQRLIDEGTLRAGDVADVITRTPVVAASKANAVLGRLAGDAKTAVEACRTWQDKPGKLTVARSVQLPAPADEPALAPAPTDSLPVGDGRPSDATSGLLTPSTLESDLNPEELFK